MKKHIKKTKYGTYQVRMRYPKDVLPYLGTSSKEFNKSFKTAMEARKTVNKLLENFNSIRTRYISTDNTPDDTVVYFADFYHNKWLPMYKQGYFLTGRKQLAHSTINATMDIVKTRLLPKFGDKTIEYLNNNIPYVLEIMVDEARQYVNFGTVRSYFLNIMDYAEELEVISTNNLRKPISKIKEEKKIRAHQEQTEEEKYLSEQQLLNVIQTIETEYKNNNFKQQDYVMFWVLLTLALRKSELYALRWKDIDFTNNIIHVEKSLDKMGNLKNTKGNKRTDYKIDTKLAKLLKEWKEEQKLQLDVLGIDQGDTQFLFTYTNSENKPNCPLYIDYLNNIFKKLRKSHPSLPNINPHKFRHTAATLAMRKGRSIADISEGLTHSDTRITQVYLNANNVIKNPLGAYVLDRIND